MIGRTLGGLALCALAATLLSCGALSERRFGESSVPGPDSNLEAAEIENTAKVQAALETGGLDAVRALIDADLETYRYAEAYEATQILRELAPADAGDLHRLGYACLGLGLYDEAAASYFAAYELDRARTEDLSWVVRILTAGGDRDKALALMDANPDVVGWQWTLLRLEATTDRAKQLQLLDAYVQAHPDEEPAATARARLAERSPEGPLGTVVSMPSGPIELHISDSYKISVSINGQKGWLLFDTGASGLILGSELAKRAGVEEGDTLVMRGIGAGGTTQGYIGNVRDVEVGPLKLSDVRARVTKNAGSTRSDADGIIGPDFFGGWSYSLDRKRERALLYPSGVPLPAPSATATAQSYHAFSHLLLTDVGVRNRVSGQGWQVKMLVDTGGARTLMNLDYAELLDFGDKISTATLPFRGLAGTTRAVQIKNSELHLGGALFQFPTFWALNGLDEILPMPYGIIGRDVLQRFVITVDTSTHTVWLDLYE